MPTGYTAAIADGITFQQYAMNCARAFGALVMMRDEPADAPIPEKFEPSDYHDKAIAESSAELGRLQSLSDAELLAEHATALREHAADYERRVAESNAIRAKYEAMLVQARAYKAPTPDHQKFAEFMVDQIVNSIDFDCKVYEREGPPADPHHWRAQECARLVRDIAYHENGKREEIERTTKRNEWIAALRKSLAG